MYTIVILDLKCNYLRLHFTHVHLGPEFESRIRQNEINNPKFNFLNPGDPYHAYFQQKVADIKEQDGQGKTIKYSLLSEQLTQLLFSRILHVYRVLLCLSVRVSKN